MFHPAFDAGNPAPTESPLLVGLEKHSVSARTGNSANARSGCRGVAGVKPDPLAAGRCRQRAAAGSRGRYLIDFESYAPGTVLTNQIPGIRFPFRAVVVQTPPSGFTIPLPLGGLHAQGSALKHVSINLANPGILNDLEQLGIKFKNQDTGQFRPIVIVSAPREGYLLPTDINGNPIPDSSGAPTSGLCIADESGAPDCRADIEMVFPTGATNVQFDIVGGYTDGFCLSRGQINFGDVLVSYSAGVQIGPYQEIGLYYRWRQHVGPLSIPFANLDSVLVQGSQRTDLCGLGVNDAGASAGGIAIANLEYDLVVPPGELEVVDPACSTDTECPGTYVDREFGDGRLVDDVTRLATAPINRYWGGRRWCDQIAAARPDRCTGDF